MSTVICICVEQTFTQAFASKRAFSEAFSVALKAYITSMLKEEVKDAIQVLNEGWVRLEEEVNGISLEKQLGDIVKSHRLRMWIFFECECYSHSGVGIDV